MPLYSQDSTSDTSSSDDDYESYPPTMYPPADDIIGVNGKIKEGLEGDYVAMADSLFPRISQVPNSTTDRRIGNELADKFFQQRQQQQSVTLAERVR